MEARSPLDHLTKLERAVVKAKLENPGVPMHVLGKIAKVGKSSQWRKAVSKILKRPQVIAALNNPPPTLNPEAQVDLDDPVKAKEWLRAWYVKIVENNGTPQSERIRALNAVAEMIPGAKVPVGVHHTGAWTLEKFVEAAGGKPPDAPGRSPDEMPN